MEIKYARDVDILIVEFVVIDKDCNQSIITYQMNTIGNEVYSNTIEIPKNSYQTLMIGLVIDSAVEVAVEDERAELQYYQCGNLLGTVRLDNNIIPNSKDIIDAYNLSAVIVYDTFNLDGVLERRTCRLLPDDMPIVLDVQHPDSESIGIRDIWLEHAVTTKQWERL